MTEKNLSKSIGKYTILDILGRGAMGIVYKAFDPLIERTVAIKVIRKAAFADDELAEALGRFRREAQAAGRLIHPHIVTVYEYGEESDTAFIAMEYVEGKSLKEVMHTRTSFTLAEIVDILNQLLTGLQYAHSSGIVHRDIKPDNLIFTPDHTLKIMDFGVAHLESSSLTMAGSVMGTPSYMAPELFSGEDVDQRSDLFSAGIILYQLLTGHKPFSGSTMTAIMHQVINVMPAKPSQLDSRLPAHLDNLIQTSLAKNPGRRFQNGTDFLTALHQAFSKVDTSLIAQADSDKISSDQEATLHERNKGSGPLFTSRAKFKQLSPPILIGAAIVLLVILTFFILKNDAPSPVADADKAAITSTHKTSISHNIAPQTLSPRATKKQASAQRTKPRTGISITSPSSAKRRRTEPDQPSSRNAISITVPDRQ